MHEPIILLKFIKNYQLFKKKVDMSNQEMTLYDYPQDKKIQTAICNAILKSLQIHSSEPKIAESFIRNLVINLPVVLNATKTPINVAGMFVHQKPYIKYANMPNNKKRIEIGDILLVRTFVKKNGSKTYSALLMQAKMCDIDNKKGMAQVGSSNKAQHYLYSFWPDFNFVSQTLTQKTRRVEGPNLYNGAKYLIFDKDFKNRLLPSKNFYCCSPRLASTAMPFPKRLARFECFAKEVFDFILGNAGREFTYKNYGSGWSQVITELIEVTVQSYVRRNKSRPRLEGIVGFIDKEGLLGQEDYIPVSINGDDIPLNISLSEYGDPEDGGIPIIEFVVHEEDIEDIF